MKISIKNLGPLKQAEFELGDLTIICGENNTGKTYATYALYGFLSSWRNIFSVRVKDKDVQKLLSEGKIVLDIQNFIDDDLPILKDGNKAFTARLPKVFASSAKYFAESSFSITLNPHDIQLMPVYNSAIGTSTTQFFTISKKAESSSLTISLLAEEEKVTMQRDIISDIVGGAIKKILFDGVFPRSFIASAERTGAAIFRKELDFARNRLLEEMASKENNIDPADLFSKGYSDYALPVKSNVDFTRRLEEISRDDSFIAKEHLDILNEFSDILGGEYLVTKNDELYYIPKGRLVKLTLGESSSSVRSLLLLDSYLNHAAKKGDLLMIDEPELNLHPENQRRMARLFARLANIGIKVFITTHSDYIIKELNTLIMLNQGGERLKELAAHEGYKAAELLNADKVKVYVAENSTLVPADIDPHYGIEVSSFDKSINEMNRIQDEIVWGETNDAGYDHPCPND